MNLRLCLPIISAWIALSSPSLPAQENPEACFLRLAADLVGREPYIMEQFARAPKFRAFLRSKKLDWENLSAQKRYRTIEDYFHAYFKRYAPGKLAEKRERALKLSLAEHGYAASGNAREAFQNLSSINLKRILPKRYVFGAIPEMREAEKLVSEIRFAFPHNVQQPVVDLPDALLLSSRQLKRLGTPGGLNSRLPFTHEFMKQDDNVFFFADVLHPKYPYPTFQYGDHGYLLNPEYAKKEAWISGFVMYPGDLYGAAKALLPESEFALLHAAESASRAPWAGAGGKMRALYELSSEQKAAWSIAKKNLHRADFTVDDFQTIVRERMLLSLNELRINDTPAYEKAMRGLIDPKSYHLAGWQFGWKDLLTDLVYSKANLPKQFELKVPVGVSPESLRVHTRGTAL